MFKVPDWEEDVPKNNTNLAKRMNIKGQKHADKPMSPKKLKIHPTKEKQAKKDVPGTAKKRKHNESIINNNKKKGDAENNIDVSIIDTDKLDEVILNAKKKKFYEPLQKDDVEHVLFKEESKTKNIHQPLKLNGNGRQLAKIIDKSKNTKNNRLLNKKTNFIPPDPDNVNPNKVFQVKTNNSEVNSNTNEVLRNTAVKPNSKKEKLKKLLQSNRNSFTVNGSKLRERMLDRLKAAQFRYINEKLYTSSGTEAKQLFQSDPAAFHTYHQGYQQQVKKWPVNPLDVIVKRIQKMPKSHTIADMGCGEAALSKRVPQNVRSFDLLSSAPGVEICDMAHTPLLAASVDVAVYCLALMGNELTQYLVEANRVLKMGGHLLIAEVESRFTDVEEFSRDVSRLGFKLKKLDKQHQVFFFIEFVKIRDPPAKKSKFPKLTLKPCLYKKR